MIGGAITTSKEYPLHYPEDAVKILSAMAFNPKDLNVVGSMALRSQAYAGDYDAYEVVQTKSIAALVKGFQDIIKQLTKMPNVYIGDIKAGIMEDWRILPKGTRKLDSHKSKVSGLLASKIITQEEADEANRLLSKPPTKANILIAQQEIKFHIIRWTPKEIATGKRTLRDGRSYTLTEAFQSPTITKLDVIGLTQGRYTDFSVIYEFHQGNRVLNPDIIDPESSLKESIVYYKAIGNNFKVAKRMFALAKLKNNPGQLKKYNAILNSDLGKLYVLLSDIKTLADVLERATIPHTQLKGALEGFKARLASIYEFEDVISKEPQILTKLEKAIQSAKPVTGLRAVEDEIAAILEKHTPA